MRVYSDLLDRDKIWAAKWDVVDAGLTTEVVVTIPKSWDARKRRYGNEVVLEGYGARHTRHKNGGNYGADVGTMAATWMDWGWLIAVMFRHDPNAVIGSYDGREDFHRQTLRQWPHRQRVDKSFGAGDFARSHAALLKPGMSPFELVDQVCPPTRLVNLTDPEVVSKWLASA